MRPLNISSNQRYFETDTNTPFIWIADTAWTLPQRMKWDDVIHYMKKRKSQGFTVLQLVALDPERDELIRNPVGEAALENGDLSKPREEYFQYLDWVIDQAKAFGFYVLLLPVWGQLVVGDNWMGQTFHKTVTENNAFAFGRWIGERYKNKSHLIWCLGGDRQPIHKGIDYKMVWRNMAEGLAKGVLNEDLHYNSDKERWSKLPLTYHACHEAETGECSTFSYWTDEECWISFIMLQSGHGLMPKNYELVQKEYNRTNKMPVWDGEPAYEKMPTSWPVIEGYHGEWMVRKRAYWSLFSGSFGHTYGHGCVWGTIGEREKNTFTPYSWVNSLDHPGANQMKYVRDFLESRKISAAVPSQELLIEQSKCTQVELDEYIACCTNKEQKEIYVYFPSGGQQTIVLPWVGQGKDQQHSLYLWWYSPKTGKCVDQNKQPITLPVLIEEESIKAGIIKLTTPTKGKEEDWIGVIEEQANSHLVVEQTYFMEEEQEGIQKVFEW